VIPDRSSASTDNTFPARTAAAAPPACRPYRHIVYGRPALHPLREALPAPLVVEIEAQPAGVEVERHAVTLRELALLVSVVRVLAVPAEAAVGRGVDEVSVVGVEVGRVVVLAGPRRRATRNSPSTL
jgi:hypothetical protein